MLTSALCTQAAMDSAEFRRWFEELNPPPEYDYHRKLWEWAFIAQALEERGFLKPGTRGLGFAVGTEPLAALFAKYGCEVVGTDLGVATQSGATAADWALTNQHAKGLTDINYYKVCPDEVVRERVKFEYADMNAIPGHLTGFDFCWSAGSVEHVGDMELSQAALVNMTNCVRPGGLSIHSTEFNLLSDERTDLEGGTVLYRRRDISAVAGRLRRAGHRLLPVDGDAGDREADYQVDSVPYGTTRHLKLVLNGYTITSITLVIEAHAVGEGERQSAGGDVWFNDEFFTSPGSGPRKRFESESDRHDARRRLTRLTELVAELDRARRPGGRTPAYRFAEVRDFLRASRDGAWAMALGDGVALAQIFGDTHAYVDARDVEAAPALLRDGATDLPGSVTLVRCVRAGQTALDVGAGCGYHTALLARLVGPGGRVVSSEPDEGCRKLLNDTVRANRFRQVEVHAGPLAGLAGAGRVDFARVGDPAQLEAAWSGLAPVRAANPGFLALLAFHPGRMADAGAFLDRVRADGYNLSLVGDDGNVAPVPDWRGAFGPDSDPWLFYAGPA